MLITRGMIVCCVLANMQPGKVTNLEQEETLHTKGHVLNARIACCVPANMQPGKVTNLVQGEILHTKVHVLNARNLNKLLNTLEKVVPTCMTGVENTCNFGKHATQIAG